MTDQSAGKELVRDNEVLREFGTKGQIFLHPTGHHRDWQRLFNAAEYHEQMLRYYAADISVRVVRVRLVTITFLVCCKTSSRRRIRPARWPFSVDDRSWAYPCRQEAMLRVPSARCQAMPRLSVRMLLFQSANKGWGAHKALCKLVKAGGLEDCGG